MLRYHVSVHRLIVTADDLGITAQRSHGIFQCIEQGVVTGVGIIPNGIHSDLDARHARERDVAAGLHLNLTEGAPLSKADDIVSLLSTEGNFVGEDTFKRLILSGEVNRTHVERELREQLQWFLDVYGQPTHVSSHLHVHVHPFIAPILAPILDRYGISFVRIPSEPMPPFGYQIPDEQMLSIQQLSHDADVARTLFEAHGIRSTDHFRGLVMQGNASQRNMRHTLGRLPEGTTELFVHPGSMNPSGDPFESDPQRQTEMQMLLRDDFMNELKEREIELISYRDLF